MEIPDVLVVNKSDHPLTDVLVRELRGALSLAPQAGWQVPIITTDALRGAGVEELEQALESHRRELEAAGTLEHRRRRNLRNEVIELASARMRRGLEQRLAGDESFERLLDEVAARRLDPASAAQRISERADA